MKDLDTLYTYDLAWLVANYLIISALFRLVYSITFRGFLLQNPTYFDIIPLVGPLFPDYLFALTLTPFLLFILLQPF